MKKYRYALALALSACASLAQAEVRVQGPVEFGLFENPSRELAPGERLLGQGGREMQQTHEIPARLGVRFGLRYQLLGKRAEDAPLTLLYLTPGVVTPDGQRHDKFEVVQKLAPEAEQDVMAFEFSERHELVPGEWRFMVFQGDRKLADERFEVR